MCARAVCSNAETPISCASSQDRSSRADIAASFQVTIFVLYIVLVNKAFLRSLIILSLFVLLFLMLFLCSELQYYI